MQYTYEFTRRDVRYVAIGRNKAHMAEMLGVTPKLINGMKPSSEMIICHQYHIWREVGERWGVWSIQDAANPVRCQ